MEIKIILGSILSLTRGEPGLPLDEIARIMKEVFAKEEIEVLKKCL